MSATTSPSRLNRIDIARGLALIAMAIYHTGWDLEFFGYMEPGTASHGGWKLFARLIASSFLILVGFSLYLAHGKAIRWHSFGKRLTMIVIAAAAISGLTYYTSPNSFIFFGILHQIALASVLGLLFLRLPALLILLFALLFFIAPDYAKSDVFNAPLLKFVGLGIIPPTSNDYVPLFPWFSAVLTGIALAKICQTYNLNVWLKSSDKEVQISKPLTFIGKHSLAFYLIHQPVLMAIIYALTFILPPAGPERAFLQACQSNCTQQGAPELCAKFCTCVTENINQKNIAKQIYNGQATEEMSQSLQESAQLCSAKTFPALQ
ncbi:heparan-alpha-glucosaminide N-acetyltransferase [Paenochrobactrum sp. BZR 588]|uniref:heparan-alpha-glucosaminide N-acetyltransferase n=1 Tax=unclassified Paenochrobactrum TaxID=2639760 RepID=UPI003853842B